MLQTCFRSDGFSVISTVVRQSEKGGGNRKESPGFTVERRTVYSGKTLIDIFWRKKQRRETNIYMLISIHKRERGLMRRLQAEPHSHT